MKSLHVATFIIPHMAGTRNILHKYCNTNVIIKLHYQKWTFFHKGFVSTRLQTRNSYIFFSFSFSIFFFFPTDLIHHSFSLWWSCTFMVTAGQCCIWWIPMVMAAESMKVTHVYVSASGTWNTIPGGIDPRLVAVGITTEGEDKRRQWVVSMFEPSTERMLEYVLKVRSPYVCSKRNSAHYKQSWISLNNNFLDLLLKFRGYNVLSNRNLWNSQCEHLSCLEWTMPVCMCTVSFPPYTLCFGLLSSKDVR